MLEATEQQYNICKAIYDEEKERYSALGVKANLYITLISFFLGAVIFKFDDLKHFLFLFHVPMVLELVAAIFLIIALGFSLHAVIIRSYQAIEDIDDIINEELAKAITNSEFFGNRINDLAVATEENSKCNDKAADDLQRAVYALLASVCIQGIIVVWAILGKILPYNA